MKISLTVSCQEDRRVQEVYDSCDLLFVTRGYTEKFAETTKTRWPSKVVELSYIYASDDILSYLRTGEFPDNSWSVDTDKFHSELLTIREGLPKNVEIEIIDFNTIFFGHSSKKITLSEN